MRAPQRASNLVRINSTNQVCFGIMIPISINSSHSPALFESIYSLLQIFCSLFSKMANCVKSANLFPYMDFWRIKGDSDVNHVCGGLTSIIVFLIIIAICLAKIIEVFSMATVFASETTIHDLIPPNINVTTFQNDPTLNPFMVGFSLSTGYAANANSLTASDVKATAVYYQEKNSGSASQTVNQTPIGLQPCTALHFSSVPDVNQKFFKWGFDRFTCIGLDKTYEIGGQRGFNNDYKSIQLKFECATSACSSSTNGNLIFTFITLDTFVNPTNASLPELAYTTPFTIALQSKALSQYQIHLDSNKVNTDGSILPFEQITTHNSVKAQPSLRSLQLHDSNALTTVWIEKSNVRTTYDRVFLKLLDAVAYAGGIFSSLLGIFFFMGGFGQFVYEMEVAYNLFKAKEAQNVGFIQFVKHSAFSVLKSTSLKPAWQKVQKQQEYKQIVNKLLDILFLLKRIAYLERAIGVLLQQHQLMGLHLIPNQTHSQVDNTYRNHRLRAKMMQYAMAKRKQRGENGDIKYTGANCNGLLHKQVKSNIQNVGNHNLSGNKSFKEINLITRPNHLYRSCQSGFSLNRQQIDEPLSNLSNIQLDQLQQEEQVDKNFILKASELLKVFIKEAEAYHGDNRTKRIRDSVGEAEWSRLKSLVREVGRSQQQEGVHADNNTGRMRCADQQIKEGIKKI